MFGCNLHFFLQRLVATHEFKFSAAFLGLSHARRQVNPIGHNARLAGQHQTIFLPLLSPRVPMAWYQQTYNNRSRNLAARAEAAQPLALRYEALF